MATQEKITQVIELKSEIGDLESAMKEVRTLLNDNKTTKQFDTNMRTAIRNIEQEIDKLKDKTTDKPVDLVDIQQSKKALSTIQQMITRMMDNTKTFDWEKAIPKETLAKISKINEIISKATSEELRSNLKIEDSKKKQLQMAESEAKIKKVQYNQYKEANDKAAKAKTALDSVWGEEGNRKRGWNLSKEGRAYLSANSELQTLQEKFGGDSFETVEKDFTKLTEKIANLNHELETLQSIINPLQDTMVSQAKSLLKQAGFEGIDDIQNYEDLSKYLADIAAKGKEAGKVTESKVTNGLNKASAAAEQMGNSMDQAGEQIQQMTDKQKKVTSFAQKLAAFFSIESAVQLFRRSINSAVETVKSLDAVMTQAAVVTNYSVGDMWDQLPEYTANANKLGVAIKDVYEASTLYYQQGLKGNAVTEVATQTLKMAKIAGLQAADATDKMTAALRGFNMEVNGTNAENVADVYSKLAAITASNVDEISSAMTKTASIANSAGMSFETTAAFLSQIIETTRESAETAGTALKTVIARFEELKKSPSEIGDIDGETVDANAIETALKSVGVALRDTEGQFRNLDDVFLELSSKWNTLDKNTQRYIATIAAGSRQQSRFIAMMQDYSRTTELVSAANNASGASTTQFEKTLESLESKLNQLKNAWNSFTMDIADSSVIKAVVDGLTWLIDGFNKLTEFIGGAQSGLVKLIATIGIFTGVSKLLSSQVMKNFVKRLQGQNSAITENTRIRKENNQVINAGRRETQQHTADVQAETNALQQNNAALIGQEQQLEQTTTATKGLSEGWAITSASLIAGGTLLSTLANHLQDVGASSEQMNDGFNTLATGLIVLGSIMAALIPLASILGAAFLPITITVIALVAVITAAVAVYKIWQRNTVTLSEAAEMAASAMSNLKQATEEANTELEHLKDAHDTYSELKDDLDGLTRGTTAWKQKVAEVNAQVLNLLNKYPQLQATVNGGVLTITEDSWDAIIAKQEADVARLSASTALAGAAATMTAATLSKSKATNSTEYSIAANQYNTAADSLVGSVVNALVGSAEKYYSNDNIDTASQLAALGMSDTDVSTLANKVIEDINKYQNMSDNELKRKLDAAGITYDNNDFNKEAMAQQLATSNATKEFQENLDKAVDKIDNAIEAGYSEDFLSSLLSSNGQGLTTKQLKEVSENLNALKDLLGDSIEQNYDEATASNKQLDTILKYMHLDNKLSEELKDNLTQDQKQLLINQLSKDGITEQQQKLYIDSINQAIEGQSDENITAIVNTILSNGSQYLNPESFAASLALHGISLDKGTISAITNGINTAIGASENYTFDTIKSVVSGLSSVATSIRNGTQTSIFTEDDYNSVIKAASKYKEEFVKIGDEYIYIGNNLNDILNDVEKYGLTSLKNDINKQIAILRDTNSDKDARSNAETELNTIVDGASTVLATLTASQLDDFITAYSTVTGDKEIDDAYTSLVKTAKNIQKAQVVANTTAEKLLASVEATEKLAEQLTSLEKEQLTKQQATIDTIHDAQSEMLSTMREQLEVERQTAENTKTEEDIANKQQKLAYLRMDTSGANALQIKQLEKEIADAQTDYQNTLIDQSLDTLENEYEKAYNQRQQMIDILTSIYDSDFFQDKQKEIASSMYESLYQENGGTKDINRSGATFTQLAQKLGYSTATEEGRLRAESAIRSLGYDSYVSKAQASQGYAQSELSNRLGNLSRDAYEIKDGQLSAINNATQNNGGNSEAYKAQTSSYAAYKNTIDSFNAGNATSQDVQKAYDMWQSDINAYNESITKNGTSATMDFDVGLFKQYLADGNGDAAIDLLKEAQTKYNWGNQYPIQKIVGTNKGIFPFTDLALGSIQTKTYQELVNERLSDLLANFDARDYVKPTFDSNGAFNPNTGSIGLNGLVQYFSGQGLNEKSLVTALSSNNKLATQLYLQLSSAMTQAYTNSGAIGGNFNLNSSSKPTTGLAAWLYNKLLEKKTINNYHEKNGKGWSVYKTGGLNTSTGPAWLDGTPTNPELVLNAKDTQNFLELTNVLRNTKEAGALNNNSETNVEVNIQVDSIGSDYDVEQLADAVTDYIARNSTTRTNNMVTRSR